MTQKAAAAARRNFAYRIGAQLAAIAKPQGNPASWERYDLDQALDHLTSQD